MLHYTIATVSNHGKAMRLVLRARIPALNGVQKILREAVWMASRRIFKFDAPASPTIPKCFLSL
jgi:hypothetical protein